MSLSIVIPARNAADSISICLSSIAENVVDDLEVIVVDDGSDDDLAAAVEAADLGDMVTLIRQSSLGVSVARNRGVACAQGEFILFMDADDCLPSDSLPAFLEQAEVTGSDICVGDFYMSRDGQLVLHRNLNTERRIFSCRDMPTFQWLCLGRVGFRRVKNVGLLGGPWAKIYRRSFLVDAFPPSGPFAVGVPRGQDVLFNVEAFGKAGRVTYHPRPTYVYTVSERSTSHRAAPDFASRVSVLVENLKTLLVREQWGYLEPAVAKVQVTLLDEAVLRLGVDPKARDIGRLARSEPFASGVDGARFRDFSFAGAGKLLLLRLRAYRLYGRLSALRRS